MCICINCLFIRNCKSYRFVEEMHNISSASRNIKNHYLSPKQTIIKNEILTISNDLKIKDWDIKECTNFVEKSGNWFFDR